MRRPLLAALLALAGSLCAVPSASAAISFAPCDGAALRGLECGELAVPLDPTGARPGTLSLEVARVRGTTGSEAVVRLGGGPGEASIPALRPFAAGFEAALAGRQVVALDVRGTGAGGFECPSLTEGTGAAGDLDDVSRAATACARRAGARLGFLTSAATAADLERLRTELGAAKLSIVASSYGAKAANEYARRYPQGVGFLVLDSPAAIEGSDLLGRDRGALPRVLRDVCAGGGCTGITASLLGDVRAVAARAATGRLTARVAGRRVRITEPTLYELVIDADLSPFGRAPLPAAFRRARQGDLALLVRLLAASTRTSTIETEPSLLSTGTLLAQSCQESPLPWSPDSAPGAARVQALETTLEALPPTTYAPFSTGVATLGASLAAVCAVWPAVPPSPPTEAPAPAGVAVLTLSGTQDARTSVEVARQLTGEYADGQVVEIAGAGHTPLTSDLTGCAALAVSSFLRTGTARQCPVVARFPAPFAAPPRSLDTAAPIQGIPGVRGRVVSATIASVDDLVQTLVSQATSGASLRLAGLRSGRASIRGGRIVLAGYETVTGVRLSGTLRIGSGVPAGTLRIRGGGGQGTLTLRGSRARGTVLDARVTVRRILPALAPPRG